MQPTDQTALMMIADELDKRGGKRLRQAKSYSIEYLREEGCTEEEINELLGLKP